MGSRGDGDNSATNDSLSFIWSNELDSGHRNLQLITCDLSCGSRHAPLSTEHTARAAHNGADASASVSLASFDTEVDEGSGGGGGGGDSTSARSAVDNSAVISPTSSAPSCTNTTSTASLLPREPGLDFTCAECSGSSTAPHVFRNHRPCQDGDASALCHRRRWQRDQLECYRHTNAGRKDGDARGTDTAAPEGNGGGGGDVTVAASTAQRTSSSSRVPGWLSCCAGGGNQTESPPPQPPPPLQESSSNRCTASRTNSQHACNTATSAHRQPAATDTSNDVTMQSHVDHGRLPAFTYMAESGDVSHATVGDTATQQQQSTNNGSCALQDSLHSAPTASSAASTPDRMDTQCAPPPSSDTINRHTTPGVHVDCVGMATHAQADANANSARPVCGGLVLPETTASNGSTPCSSPKRVCRDITMPTTADDSSIDVCGRALPSCTLSNASGVWPGRNCGDFVVASGTKHLVTPPHVNWQVDSDLVSSHTHSLSLCLIRVVLFVTCTRICIRLIC